MWCLDGTEAKSNSTNDRPSCISHFNRVGDFHLNLTGGD